jgi:hypothetical protein
MVPDFYVNTIPSSTMSNITVIIKKDYLKAADERADMKQMAIQVQSELAEDINRHNLHPPFIIEVV